MKVLTINELVEKLMYSPDSAERLCGQILTQCDFRTVDGETYIGVTFEDNNIVIIYNEDAFFRYEVDEQIAMLKYAGTLISKESRLRGEGKAVLIWNAAIQIHVLQDIIDFPPEGDLLNIFSLPHNLTADEYYDKVGPILIDKGFIPEDYSDPIILQPGEYTVTKSIIKTAMILSGHQENSHVQQIC